MVIIVWSELALDDLKAIHYYISKDSVIYASRQIDRMIERVEQLTQFPLSGRVVPEFNLNSIRELIEGNYRIIYQLSNDVIEIVRVHHAAKEFL